MELREAPNAWLHAVHAGIASFITLLVRLIILAVFFSLSSSISLVKKACSCPSGLGQQEPSSSCSEAARTSCEGAPLSAAAASAASASKHGAGRGAAFRCSLTTAYFPVCRQQQALLNGLPAQYGNATTFNLENVLKKNIVDSDYYNKSCLQLMSWSDVVDEIYENVDHVEPWMSGNARGPSTAFCLMHRLATLKPSVKEVRDTITHKDSPYIRAVSIQSAVSASWPQLFLHDAMMLLDQS